MSRRKSIKLGSYTKLNINTRSVGVSVGTRRARVSTNTRGESYTTVHAAGFGHTRRSTSKSRRGRGRSATSSAVLPAPFSSKDEKALFLGLKLIRDGLPYPVWAPTVRAVADTSPKFREPALFLIGSYATLPDHAEAALLELAERNFKPKSHRFARRYLRRDRSTFVSIGGIGPAVHVGLSPDLVPLRLVQMYLRHDQLDKAREVAGRLSGSRKVRPLRAELDRQLARPEPQPG